MTIFDTPGPYLINDRYKTDPTGRFLDFLIKKREEGAPVVGRYCGYAPLELIRAVGAVPVSLCASSQWSVPAAEAVLPANLCPLIKSSFGFIRTDSCPLFALSEAVIGETTCDGKKKMFELISHLKPTHVMDLPNMPKGFGVGDQWLATVRKLKEFLETTFQKHITAERLEEEIRETNRKNSLIDGFFDCLTRHPPPVCWQEIYDVIGLDPISTGEELQTLMAGIAARLEERVEAGVGFGAPSSPRVLVTGCPIGCDALKVLKITEEAGGVVVALEACSGMKGYAIPVAEGTGDPLRAIAEATLKIPCSCMSPNRGRLDMLDGMIARFKPDVVIDVILHACHGYNVESFKIRQHIQDRHGLPFLKIETDYAAGDVEQIRTRVEALFEGL